MELQGTIHKIMEPRGGISQRTGEPWKSQEFVLQHMVFGTANYMVFTVFGEDRLNRFAIKEGQKVNVAFDINAREYNGKWYNDIRAYDVRPVTDDGTLKTANPTEEQKGGEPDF